MDAELKAIIVEDERLGIDLIKQCMEGRFEVCATAQTMEDGWKAFSEHEPDVVILDIELPDGSGLDLANRMLQARPGVKILGVSAKTDQYTLYKVFSMGFFGFVDKNTESVEELRTAIHQMADGNCYYSAVVQQNAMVQRSDPKAFSRTLTEREQQLMCYFGVGASNELIAEKLGLRPISVQNHRFRIMKKLGLHSTVDLIRYAMKTGFVNSAGFRDAEPS